MMSCKTYVFKLSSGQLQQARLGERMWAAQHRLMCRACRAFTRNDRVLDEGLRAYLERLTRP